MKLKTLKNIEKCPNCMAEDKPKCIQCLELRREAIKHIKNIRAGKITNKTGMRLRNMEFVIVDWIMYFFNITEEDLK